MYSLGSMLHLDLQIYVDNYPHMSGVWSLSYNAKLVLDVIVHRFLSHGCRQSMLNVSEFLGLQIETDFSRSQDTMPQMSYTG